MTSSEERFDVVVIGAGMAGLACAGTLVEEGLRPLLICETPDVGWNLRSKIVEGNRGFVQHPALQIGWGGGFWYGLARRLNLPVTFHYAPPAQLLVRGAGGICELPMCTSAAALVNVIGRVSPFPIDAIRDELDKIMFEALAIPWQELGRLADVPFTRWLEDQGAGPATQMLMAVLCANLGATTPAAILEHMSAFGAIGGLRSLVCGEGPMTVIEPDVREGLLVPLADAIERQGGEIWRRCPVRQVIHDGTSVKSVLLKDGRQIDADVVALATGTSRVGTLLADRPADVQAAVDQASRLGSSDVAMFSVLNRPVVEIDRYTLVASDTGENLAWLFPMHNLAPWTTQPGKQFLVALSFHITEQFEATGGEPAAIERLTALQEELFPGFRDATEAVEYQRHRHFWMNPMTHGPKLPSCSETIRGLWFAGDGSVPIGGIAVEAAASAGVLRARQIAAALRP